MDNPSDLFARLSLTGLIQFQYVSSELVVKCWARTLGGCSNIQSREHYLSQSLWEGDTITVKGLWEEERTIGLGSLTAKNLCRKHNEILSPLDSEAKKIFHIIGELYRLQDVRLKLKPKNSGQLRDIAYLDACSSGGLPSSLLVASMSWVRTTIGILHKQVLLSRLRKFPRLSLVINNLKNLWVCT